MLIWSPTVVSQHLSKSDERDWLTRWPPRSFINPIWHSVRLYLDPSAIMPLCFHLLQFSLMVGLPCWGVSRSVTHKHQRWIWFTLSYAMLKAFLRLAAVRDTKQAGELRDNTVHFTASSSARFFMMQNGNIYRPLKQTETCLLRLYSSKHIAENS